MNWPSLSLPCTLSPHHTVPCILQATYYLVSSLRHAAMHPSHEKLRCFSAKYCHALCPSHIIMHSPHHTLPFSQPIIHYHELSIIHYHTLCSSHTTIHFPHHIRSPRLLLLHTSTIDVYTNIIRKC